MGEEGNTGVAASQTIWMAMEYDAQPHWRWLDWARFYFYRSALLACLCFFKSAPASLWHSSLLSCLYFYRSALALSFSSPLLACFCFFSSAPALSCSRHASTSSGQPVLCRLALPCQHASTSTSQPLYTHAAHHCWHASTSTSQPLLCHVIWFCCHACTSADQLLLCHLALPCGMHLLLRASPCRITQLIAVAVQQATQIRVNTANFLSALQFSRMNLLEAAMVPTVIWLLSCL